jgi:hypothetical protein
MSKETMFVAGIVFGQPSMGAVLRVLALLIVAGCLAAGGQDTSQANAITKDQATSMAKNPFLDNKKEEKPILKSQDVIPNMIREPSILLLV